MSFVLFGHAQKSDLAGKWSLEKIAFKKNKTVAGDTYEREMFGEVFRDALEASVNQGNELTAKEKEKVDLGVRHLVNQYCNSEVEFNEDGSFSHHIFLGDDIGGTYIIKGDSLTMRWGKGVEVVFEIVKLNSKTLQLKSKDIHVVYYYEKIQ